MKPLSEAFGYDRGTPIDRHYIESFLTANESDIRGTALEVGDDTYLRRFGGGRVTTHDVLHIRQTPNATIIGDLAKRATLPESTYDCIVLTQTIHLVFDLQAAVENLHRALRPNGVALITAPTMPPIDRGEWGASWCWGFTELSLRRLLLRCFDPGKLEVSSFGNLVAATAFLHGASVEEVGRHRLNSRDPAFPVTVVARAVA